MNIADYDTRLFQNSIRYLHDVSTLPETNVPALKSSLCLKRRLMELRKSIFLPTNVTKANHHCPRCFLNLFDGPATYKVQSKPIKYTFADKIMAKQKRKEPLTKYQQQYFKKMEKFTGNQLVTVCKFCKHESFTKLLKPRIKKKSNISVQPNSVSRKKKKKNKKDKFCGLNQTIVTSVSSAGGDEQNTPKHLKNRNSKDKLSNNLKKHDMSTSSDLGISKTSISSTVLNEQNTPKHFKNKKNFKGNNTHLLFNNSKKHDTSASVNSPRSKTSILQKLGKNKSNSEVICIDSDESVQEVAGRRMKMKKKPEPVQTSTPIVDLSSSSIKKKNKNRSKLSEIFKNSGKRIKSSNLMHFLQDL